MALYLINDEGKKGSHGGHGVLTRNHSASSFDQNAGEWLQEQSSAKGARANKRVWFERSSGRRGCTCCYKTRTKALKNDLTDFSRSWYHQFHVRGSLTPDLLTLFIYKRMLALSLFASHETANPFVNRGGRAHCAVRRLRELPHHACGGILRGRILGTHRRSDADQYGKMGRASCLHFRRKGAVLLSNRLGQLVLEIRHFEYAALCAHPAAGKVLHGR